MLFVAFGSFFWFCAFAIPTTLTSFTLTNAKAYSLINILIYDKTFILRIVINTHSFILKCSIPYDSDSIPIDSIQKETIENKLQNCTER